MQERRVFAPAWTRRRKNGGTSNGQKKYPGLCLNGSVMSGDKPRYLVIWSKSNSIGQASLASNEVFGQTASALQATAPRHGFTNPGGTWPPSRL